MNYITQIKNNKKYSNTYLFEKRSRDFNSKRTSLSDDSKSFNKTKNYGLLNNIINNNKNNELYNCTTSRTYFLSDINKPKQPLRNKFYKKLFKNKHFNKNSSKSRKNINHNPFEINNIFFTDNSLINSFRNFSPYNVSKQNNTYIRNNKINEVLIDKYINNNNKTSYLSNINYDYLMLNNFSNFYNADILLHFESEKKLANENDGKILSEVNIKNNKKIPRIKSAYNFNKLIEHKNKKINLIKDDRIKYLNKTRRYKLLEFTSKIKDENYLRLQENYQNIIESYDDRFHSLEKTKKLFNIKFIEKLSDYIKYINSKKEKEKNKCTSLINKIIAYKNDIKQLNHKIKKKIIEKSNILKWIYFQIQLKEKKICLPSYYRTIIESRDIKHYKKKYSFIIGKKQVEKGLKRYNSNILKKPQINNENEIHNKDIDFDINNSNLFYNCEIDLNDQENIKEINKVKKYKKELIFSSVDEFNDAFIIFEKKNISLMKYYYKLKMIIFYMKKELAKIENDMKQSEINNNNSIKMIQKEQDEINKDIKHKNKIIQQLNNKKKNINFFDNLNNNNTHKHMVYNNKNKEKLLLFDKISILYKACKTIKISFKINKDKKFEQKEANNYLYNNLYKLKYITFVVDYLLAQFKIYNSHAYGKRELYIELKNEIDKKHKNQKANEKILKDNEKNNRLKRKIEERNNKIYFLPYKKINIYNNYQRKGIKSSDLNRSTNIHFDDLIIEK